MHKISKTALTFLVFGFAFLYIPLLFVIINSFSESSIPGVWKNFSLKWFKAVFEDKNFLRAVFTSLKIATISATIAVFLGVLAATFTTKSKNFFGKKILIKIMPIPVIMPEIIIGFSLLLLFIYMEKTFGWPQKRGVMTVIIGHTIATMAYVHITIRSRLLALDSLIEEAAMDLGARPLIIFFKIKIPMILQSIASSWLLAFTLSLDDLVIASFLNGPGATTLPILIFSNIKTGVSPMINAFATIFIFIVIICLVLGFLLASKKK